MMSNGIKSVIKILTSKKSSEPDDFAAEFYQIFRNSNSNSSEVIPKNLKRTKFFQAHSMRSALYWHQNRQRHNKKKATTQYL
jgi:hypothetical protein